MMVSLAMISTSQAKMVVIVLGFFAVIIGLAASYKYMHLSNSEVIPSQVDEQIVYGIVVNNQAKAYYEKYLKQQMSLTDEVAGSKVRIINDEGTIIFQNLETKEQLEPEKTSIANWQAAHPDTEVY